METPFILFLLLFALYLAAILFLVRNRSGRRIGKDIGRSTAYGLVYLVSLFIVGIIPYFLLFTIGFKGSAAKGVAIAFGATGIILTYTYFGKWVERNERTRERKVEQANDGDAEKPPGVDRGP